MKKEEYILLQVRNKVRNIIPDAKIILFGSRARKDNRINSDWDFLILTNQIASRDLKNKISDTLFETEIETQSSLTTILQNFNSWKAYSNTPIFKNISKDGIEIL